MHLNRCLVSLFLLLTPFYSESLFANKPTHFELRSGEKVDLEICRIEDLEKCEEIFIRAFEEAYKEFTVEQLGIKNKRQFLIEAFADVYEDVRTTEQQLFVIRVNGEVVGFSGFKKTDVPNEVYITQLAVDPSYWQQGMGKHLVFSVLSIFEDTNHLLVMPRKINEVARQFYKHIGFKECSYIHAGYSAEKYTGYELYLKER